MKKVIAGIVALVFGIVGLILMTTGVGVLQGIGCWAVIAQMIIILCLWADFIGY